jgi:hypothetical protein
MYILHVVVVYTGNLQLLLIFLNYNFTLAQCCLVFCFVLSCIHCLVTIFLKVTIVSFRVVPCDSLINNVRHYFLFVIPPTTTKFTILPALILILKNHSLGCVFSLWLYDLGHMPQIISYYQETTRDFIFTYIIESSEQTWLVSECGICSIALKE